MKFLSLAAPQVVVRQLSVQPMMKISSKWCSKNKPTLHQFLILIYNNMHGKIFLSMSTLIIIIDKIMEDIC